MSAIARPLPERLWSRVAVMDSGCWEYLGHRDRDGYGRLQRTRAPEMVRAHRAAWELARGPIPAGLHVCHKCDNPPCCNPDHLFLGTNRDNTDDKVGKGRSLRGERHPRAKLTNEQVTNIFGLSAKGWTGTAIAVRFGCSRGYINKILRGEHRTDYKAGATDVPN